MDQALGPMLIGIICICLGISNARGNIASIHWYHRKRVAAENVRPFGRLVGLGTGIIGGALIVYGGLTAAANDLCTLIAAIVLTAGVIAGLGLTLYAMFKYNKGIF